MTCDKLERKTFIISIRSGAMVFLFGMTLINICLGLFNLWLILQFSLSSGLHIYIFIKSLEMRDDRSLFNFRRGPFDHNHLESDPSTSQSNEIEMSGASSNNNRVYKK
jgi:hypothetical protein